MIIQINGIIINERNYSENDKIITIFCDDGSLHSVKVVAGRKLKNVNRSKTQMFGCGEFTIKQNDDKFSVLRSASINNNYLDLKIDIDKYYAALYFCELVVKVGYYNNLERIVYEQFILALNRLASGEENETTRIVFEFIILRYIGLQPHFGSCVICGKTSIVSVDYKLGGFICSNCFDYTHKTYDVKTLAMLKTLSSVNFDQIGKITLSDQVKNDITKFIDVYMEYHLNIKLNTKYWDKLSK